MRLLKTLPREKRPSPELMKSLEVLMRTGRPDSSEAPQAAEHECWKVRSPAMAEVRRLCSPGVLSPYKIKYADLAETALRVIKAHAEAGTLEMTPPRRTAAEDRVLSALRTLAVKFGENETSVLAGVARIIGAEIGDLRDLGQGVSGDMPE